MRSETSLRPVLLPACVAAIGGFLFGFDSGVINGAVGALSAAFGSSAAVTGFNVASMLLGCAAGAFLAGRASDAFGRRSALFGAAFLFAISAWGSGIAGGSIEFVIYRLIGGFAVGAASIICPAYIAEIAPAAIRGRLATLQQLAIVLGLFAAFLSNFIIARLAGGTSTVWLFGYQAWQWMFWVELIPSVAFFLGLLLIPESPRYLVTAGRHADAIRAHARLAPGADGQAHIAEISLSLDSGKKPAFRDLWDSVSRRLHPVVWVGIIIAALQQLVGINVVFYYGEVLWRAAGFSVTDALKINVIGGIINITATLVAIALIDRIGRKPLLLIGSIGMAVFLGVLAAVFSGAATGADGSLVLDSNHGTIALVAANLYIVCFGISWGPVMWVLLGEMFPNRLRGAALSLAGLVQWAANFAVTITFPLLLAGIGLGGAYGIYAVFAAFSAWYAWKFVRETKGRTLEQMSNG
ncbi:sugar porter family MFS transporter [Rariglobus hedericola]|uniref:Sugar porter family MFS transporter n=1 Tax=Rariglobus hedericola TaxID=2597822 RepID=A0A556QIZ8_9BACT|nr:sugar porter family MFS transporter [Rariglobus hedericola]TSJ76599.1 sugar porter family MFS transporter [Rariglobus hedericola]